MILSAANSEAAEKPKIEKRIAINSASRLMTYYENGVKKAVYPLGLGKTYTPTPVGYFKIQTKEINPPWIDPADPEYKKLIAWLIDNHSIAEGEEDDRAFLVVSQKLVAGIMKKNSTFRHPSGVVQVDIELETDPVQLASEYTPSNLRSKEYFKKTTI